MIYLVDGVIAMQNINPLEWIWEPLIPRNCVSILASRGGVGKSGFALWLANLLAGEGKRILYVDAERCGCHIKQRTEDWTLDNLSKIIFTVENLEDGSSQTAAPSTLVELHQIVKDCLPDLVILDSLTVFARSLDTNRRDHMAQYLEELTKICIECNSGILLLAHTKKKQQGEDTLTLDSVAGSGAITDLARSVMLMDFASDADGRIITQLKFNLTAKSKPLMFKITNTGIHDVKFQDAREGNTGTKADRFRLLATKCLSEGMSKKDARQILKEDGASPAEYGRALDWASSQLHIEWMGEL